MIRRIIIFPVLIFRTSEIPPFNVATRPGIVLEFFLQESRRDVSSHICFHLLTDLYHHNSMSRARLKPVDNQRKRNYKKWPTIGLYFIKMLLSWPV